MSEPIDGKIVAQVAKNAGFSGDDLTNAVAIAAAESSWKADNYWPEDEFFDEKGISQADRQGKGSYGLFQIFLYLHPEFDGWNLFDPQCNACAANLLYRRARNSFEPWSTYPEAYLKHVAQAQEAVAALTLPSP